MADLFSNAVTNISFQALQEFLGLSQPENQRIPEGPTIDYKKDLPNDLGQSVAALANSYGGLIFIGIKSDKSKNNVPVEWTGVNLGADPIARLTNKIISTVRPPP